MQSFFMSLLLLPVFAALGAWFATHGRGTTAFKVVKMLHTSYLLVLGITLITLSVSTLKATVPNSFEHWVQFFLTNMFVVLYLVTALPFMLSFRWFAKRIAPPSLCA